MTITILASVTGHTVVAGIHACLRPLPCWYSLCLYQIPLQVLVLYLVK